MSAYNTARTAARIANLRQVIATLAERELLRDEVAGLFGMSPAAGRSYINQLRPILHLVRRVEMMPGRIGQPVYRLVEDADAVKSFLAVLDTNPIPPQPVRKTRALPVGPGRHFHILADDTHYAIRVNRVAVHRDPLVAALFGAAKLEVRA